MIGNYYQHTDIVGGDMSLLLSLAAGLVALAQLGRNQSNDAPPQGADPRIEPYWQRRSELLRELTTPDLKAFAVLAFNASVMLGLAKDGRTLVEKPFFVATMLTGLVSCLLIFGALQSRLPKNRVRKPEDVDALMAPTLEYVKNDLFRLEVIRWIKHRYFNWGLRVSVIMLTATVVGFCW